MLFGNVFARLSKRVAKQSCLRSHLHSPLLAAGLVAGMLLPTAPFADRDRFVTGSALGVAPGKSSTGGLADYSLIGTLPGGMMIGSSGRCYAWTQSGRLVRAGCP